MRGKICSNFKNLLGEIFKGGKVIFSGVSQGVRLFGRRFGRRDVLLWYCFRRGIIFFCFVFFPQGGFDLFEETVFFHFIFFVMKKNVLFF